MEADRGLLKKIQLRVPGYAGYRRREDIRAADNILRIRIQEAMKALRIELENIREAAARSPRMSVTAVGNVMFELQGMEARVRHGEGGYSGLSPAIRIEEDELDRLYEYDYAMIEGLDRAVGNTPALRAAAEATDKAAFEKAVQQLRADLRAFDDAFKKRIEIVTGTEVRR